MIMHYDIVIVGGGAVGLSLFGCLSKVKNLKILVLDSRRDLNQDRFIVLSEVSRQLYKRLGCWPVIEKECVPISAIQVSMQGQYGTSVLKADQIGCSALGYVIALSQLEKALASPLVQNARLIECYFNHKWQLKYEQNSVVNHITSDCLIGTDGQNSVVRTQNKIPLITKEYGHQALMGTVSVQVDSPYAFERFLKKGAIAFLPLKNKRAVFIWTLANEQALALFQETDQALLNLLQAEFGYRLGKLSDLQSKKIFPLNMTQAQCQGKPDRNLLLMGAAALNLHPIGAQGLNLSLKTIEILSRLFKDQENQPVYCFERLIQAYLEAIGPHQLQARWMTDKLASYVSGGPFPLPLRGLGMMIFNTLPFLKKTFTKVNAGLGLF